MNKWMKNEKFQQSWALQKSNQINILQLKIITSAIKNLLNVFKKKKKVARTEDTIRGTQTGPRKNI